METFLATGVHPEVERARKAQQDIIPPLPERSTQRQHVFLTITVNNQPKGAGQGSTWPGWRWLAEGPVLCCCPLLESQA